MNYNQYPLQVILTSQEKKTKYIGLNLSIGACRLLELWGRFYEAILQGLTDSLRQVKYMTRPQKTSKATRHWFRAAFNSRIYQKELSQLLETPSPLVHSVHCCAHGRENQDSSAPYMFTSFILFSNINFPIGGSPRWCRGWNSGAAIAQRSECAVAKGSSLTVETHREGPVREMVLKSSCPPYIQWTPVVEVYPKVVVGFLVTLVGCWPVMHVG